MDADKAPVLLETDDAMDLGLGHETDLVTKTAFWALKAEHHHPVSHLE
jgi:hypothetical protein